jgi:hypothetical protein
MNKTFIARQFRKTIFVVKLEEAIVKVFEIPKSSETSPKWSLFH